MAVSTYTSTIDNTRNMYYCYVYYLCLHVHFCRAITTEVKSRDHIDPTIEKMSLPSEAVTVQWVSDQLHQILGLSDKYIAQFLVGLAKKANSVTEFYSRLEDTGTIKLNDEVRRFASELWNKVPHKKVVEKPGRAKERDAIKEQQRTKSYKLISDPEEEDEVDITTTQEDKRKKKVREKKRKHLRTDKTSKWESDGEVAEDESSAKKKKDDSSSDEWEKAEEERMKDLEERDALAERIKKRDKEHTRKIAEKSDKKVIRTCNCVVLLGKTI